MKPVYFIINNLPAPARLDKVLQQQFPNWGRKEIKAILNQRKVKVNAKIVWMGSWKVKNRDQIQVTDPPRPKRTGPSSFSDDWIVAEEDDLIVVNKPEGLRSQGVRKSDLQNLHTFVAQRYGNLNLFHRIDRDTSGLVLFTRPGAINAYLDTAFKQRLVVKEYIAVVAAPNRLEPQGEIIARLDTDPNQRDKIVIVEKGGKSAHTKYDLLEDYGDRQLIKLSPQTGRTHQLRVHLAHLGAVVLGDRLYGGRTARRLMLHAQRLTLPEMGEFPEREYFVEPGEDWKV
jgi:23S rRNA pseudouridine1911/1915/1917 synthase